MLWDAVDGVTLGLIGTFLGGNPSPGSAVLAPSCSHCILPRAAKHMRNLNGFGGILLFLVPFPSFLS